MKKYAWPGIIAFCMLLAFFGCLVCQCSADISDKGIQVAQKPKIPSTKPKIPTKNASPSSPSSPSTSKPTNQAKLNLQICSNNLNMIAEAAKKYQADNGKPPKSLYDLSPKYLNALPRCPIAKNDNYSATYVVQNDGKSIYFCCSGQNHKDAGSQQDYPRFSTDKGLELKAELVTKPQTKPAASPENIAKANDLFKKGIAAYKEKRYKQARTLLYDAVTLKALDTDSEKEANRIIKEVRKMGF